MITPQILTGQQAIEQFGMNALIECRVAVTLTQGLMQIAVIVDPCSCVIDEDDQGVLWAEYQADDDWYLHSIQVDDQFVLLDDKNPPASNEVLAKRIVELSAERDSALADYKELQRQHDELQSILFNEREKSTALTSQIATLRVFGAAVCIELPEKITRAQYEFMMVVSPYGELGEALQCLAEIRALTAEEYYYMGWEHSLSTKSDDGDHYGCGKRLAKEFADAIRQKAKGE